MSNPAKLGIAMLTVAVLLFNPIGTCAKPSVLSAPAHPCCPEKQPVECHAQVCTCVYIEQALLTVSANDDPVMVLDFPDSVVPGVALATASELPGPVPILPGVQDTYLGIHQLRL